MKTPGKIRIGFGALLRTPHLRTTVLSRRLSVSFVLFFTDDLSWAIGVLQCQIGVLKCLISVL